MRLFIPLGIILLFAMSSLPVAAQDIGIVNPYGPAPTRMYFHFDGRQDFPINTQVPPDAFNMAQPNGIITHSMECMPSAGDGAPPPLVRNTHHTEYGYSSPGYVEYQFEDPDGKPRYHKERGISFDVDLDLDVAPVLTWFVETQVNGANVQGQADPNQATVPVPQVVVEATVREGDDVSVDHIALNTGPVVASGITEPATLLGAATPDHPQVTFMGQSDRGHPYYKFEFPLTYETQRSVGAIRADQSFNVRVDIYIDEPLGVCTGPGHPESSTIMPDFVKIYSGMEARPNILWTVLNPIVIDYIHPQFVGDELVIHTSSNSPWGNYDVAEITGPYSTPGGMDLLVEGPSIPISIEQAAFVQRYHEHDHHTEAVDATWVWDYKGDRAASGDYTVTLNVKNDQETAVATGVVSFNIGSGTVQGCGATTEKLNDDCFVDTGVAGGTNVESPGFGLVAALAGVAAVLAARRR